MTTTTADTMTRVANVASKQKKTILVLLTGVVAIAAAYGIYSTRKFEHQAAGSEALYHARIVYGKEMDAALDALKPKTKASVVKTDGKTKNAKEASTSLDNWNPAEVKFDVANQTKNGILALEGVANDFDRTLAAFEARLLLGNLFYDHGQGPDALKKAFDYYKMAADKSPGTEQTIAGLYAAGFAQEAMGNCADAVKTFDQALNYGKSIHQADLLKAQARCYSTIGKKDDAGRVYEKMISFFPNTEHSRYAQTKKADLK